MKNLARPMQKWKRLKMRMQTTRPQTFFHKVRRIFCLFLLFLTFVCLRHFVCYSWTLSSFRKNPPMWRSHHQTRNQTSCCCNFGPRWKSIRTRNLPFERAWCWCLCLRWKWQFAQTNWRRLQILLSSPQTRFAFLYFKSWVVFGWICLWFSRPKQMHHLRWVKRRCKLLLNNNLKTLTFFRYTNLELIVNVF